MARGVVCDLVVMNLCNVVSSSYDICCQMEELCVSISQS